MKKKKTEGRKTKI